MVFSWRELPPTPGQILSIMRMCVALKEPLPLEGTPRNRMEARNLQNSLRLRLLAKNRLTGPEIAKRLGIRYDGAQVGVGMQFTDTGVTGTTFYGNDLKQVKSKLMEKRELWGVR